MELDTEIIDKIPFSKFNSRQTMAMTIFMLLAFLLMDLRKTNIENNLLNGVPIITMLAIFFSAMLLVTVCLVFVVNEKKNKK